MVGVTILHRVEVLAGLLRARVQSFTAASRNRGTYHGVVARARPEIGVPTMNGVSGNRDFEMQGTFVLTSTFKVDR